MSVKPQPNSNSWSDSKQIFFTPKLSLEGKNMFPIIGDNGSVPIVNRETPFLNILKKPIMSLYQRVNIKSQKRPVCIVGLPKQVEARHIKTGSIRRNKISQSTTQPSQIQSTVLPQRKQSNYILSPFLMKVKYQPPIRNLIPEVKNDGSHFYHLGEGNNSQLMEKILQRRQGWYPTNNSIFHLRWEQARPKYQNSCAPHRQVFNHLPNHEAISDKGNLLLNLKQYCQKHQQYMYEIVPVSFYLDFSNNQIIQQQLKHFVQFYWECLNHESDFISTVSGRQSKHLQSRRDKLGGTRRNLNIFSQQFDVKMQSPQKGKKDSTRSSNFRALKSRSQINNHDNGKKRQQIRNYYKSLVSLLKGIYNFQDMSSPKRQNLYVNPTYQQAFKGNLWLLKPSDLNRGRGIKLFETIEQLGELLKQQLTRNQKGSFIIQKYLQKPMLIQQRKFDIRVWALVTHNRQLYFFKEGYIRLSGEKFSLDSKSLFTHLTNNAVQKRAANYGEFQEGNILPINYLFKNGYIQKDYLYSSIKQHIMTTIKAGGSKLYIPGDKNQSILVNPGSKATQGKTKYFQIFGYDFMIDSSQHVWLIQVNTNPCIQLSNKWLTSIIPRMLDDAMKLTIDRIFLRKKNLKDNLQQFEVQGYNSQESMWQPLLLENPQVILPS